MDSIIEILIPFFFFIIWILSSISAGKKKRSQQTPRSTGPHPEPRHQPHSTDKPSNPMDELKRTLENIFDEMSGEHNEETEQQPVPEYREEEVPVTVQTPKESYKERVKQEQIQLRKFYDNYQSEEVSSLKFSPEELRKAVIYSEIISSPVSIRE